MVDRSNENINEMLKSERQTMKFPTIINNTVNNESLPIIVLLLHLNYSTGTKR